MDKPLKDSLYDYFPIWLPKDIQDYIVGSTMLGIFVIPVAVSVICVTYGGA